MKEAERKDLAAFRNKIFGVALLIALLMEAGSLPFLGPDVKYAYGLALGTCVAVANFSLMSRTLQWVVEGHSKGLLFLGYFARLALCSAAAVSAFRLSVPAGFGCFLGLLTVKISIYYIHGFKARFSTGRKVRPEVEAEYRAMDEARERKRNQFSAEEEDDA